MSEHIRNAEYRRFWEALMLKHYERVISGGMPSGMSTISLDLIDAMCADWAEHFADAETLRDIEENAARRAGGMNRHGERRDALDDLDYLFRQRGLPSVYPSRRFMECIRRQRERMDDEAHKRMVALEASLQPTSMPPRPWWRFWA